MCRYMPHFAQNLPPIDAVAVGAFAFDFFPMLTAARRLRG